MERSEYGGLIGQKIMNYFQWNTFHTYCLKFLL